MQDYAVPWIGWIMQRRTRGLIRKLVVVNVGLVISYVAVTL